MTRRRGEVVSGMEGDGEVVSGVEGDGEVVSGVEGDRRGGLGSGDCPVTE